MKAASEDFVAPSPSPQGERLTTKGRKRIAFVIAHLGPGGAQRVVANAANALADRGFEIHVIALGDKEPAYQLHPMVRFHRCASRSQPSGPAKATPDRLRAYLPQSFVSTLEPTLDHRLTAIALNLLLMPARFLKRWLRGILVWPRRAAPLRKTLKSLEADAVLSFLTQTNIVTILASRGLNVHTVVSERNDPRLQTHRFGIMLMRWLVYRWADVVTANSRGALTALQSYVPKRKLSFLPNPLALGEANNVASLDAPTVITVARLVEQKGIDVLLVAWAKCSGRLPGWRLAIVGDGPLRSDLESLCQRLQIVDSVDWFGHVDEPLPFVRGAEFFVMTSRFEGTPNALLEAMACGLPAVTSDSSPGPIELVGTDESAGLIVRTDDADATADAILRLAGDKALRRRLAVGARERVREYESHRALQTWLHLLRCAD